MLGVWDMWMLRYFYVLIYLSKSIIGECIIPGQMSTHREGVSDVSGYNTRGEGWSAKSIYHFFPNYDN